MDNKVNFLRGTATEYEASTKDSDVFYYTTDTKKLYLGETEITGIGIDDTSTTATDKTWSAKKINEHTDNAEIHVTAEEKAAWNAVNYSNPNLLINPDFKINQYGITSVAGGAVRVYFADRWHSVGCSVTNTAGVVSAAWDGSYIYDDGTNMGYIQSVLELPELIGKQVTLSVDIDDVRHHAVFTIPTTFPGIVRKTVIEDVDIAVGNYINTGIAAILFFKSTTSHTIGNVKLETGGIATPFVPPDPATELAKCQRYLWVLKNSNLRIGVTEAYNENHAVFYMYAPAALRGVPTVSYENLVLALRSNGNATKNIDSIRVAACTSNIIKMYINVASDSPLTVGEWYELGHQPDAAGTLIFDAEI